MSDRVQTAIKVVKVIFQIAGYLWALWGGGQMTAAALAPNAYGGIENEIIARDNTVYGLVMAFLAPLIAGGVSKFWAWKRGRKATPVLDYGVAIGCVVNLREYLADEPSATAPLDAIKAMVVKREADRVDPPAPAPVVEAKS